MEAFKKPIGLIESILAVLAVLAYLFLIFMILKVPFNLVRGAIRIGSGSTATISVQYDSSGNVIAGSTGQNSTSQNGGLFYPQIRVGDVQPVVPIDPKSI